jgi:Flp pilus assembly protein TadG
MQKQRGTVSVIVAFFLPVMLGIASLAIDLSYLHLVRNELQNAADAAALAGAARLRNNSSASLQWTAAEQTARQAVTWNTADGQSLTDGTVQTGYWNPSTHGAVLQGLPMTPTRNDVPAVQVQLHKSAGQNNGEVPSFFARLWGWLSTPLHVTAVAGLTSPGAIAPGGVFPLVINQCVYNTYWRTEASPPGPLIDPVTHQPYLLNLMAYDDKPSDPCKTFQWSSLLTDNNDVSTIRDLVNHKNPEALSIGEKIWIEPGSKNTLYDSVYACSAAAGTSCEYVVLPMVQSIAAHQAMPISGFACARIASASRKDRTISIQLNTPCPQVPSSGIGPDFGVVSPPSLLH